MSRAPRRFGIGALRVAVPVLVLILVWQLADGAEVIDRLRRLEWGWLAAGLVALAAQTVLSALRWRLVAGALGIALSTDRAIGEYFVAQLINQTLPGGVVGDAARAVRNRQAAGLSKAAQAVVIERLAGQIALLAVLGTGLLLSLAGAGSLAWPGGTGDGVATALLIAVPVSLFIGLAAMTIRRLRGFLRMTAHALWAPGMRGRQIALGVAIVACNLAAFAFCARATGTALGLEAVAVLVPLILCAMLIPATIAGWGFREGAAAALFPLAGASAAAGMAASVAFGAAMVISSLPGAVIIFAPRQPIGTPRS